MLGGKGGFGALLRGAGSKRGKKVDQGDCRDLNGRRVRYARVAFSFLLYLSQFPCFRHVRNEKKLEEFYKKKAEEESNGGKKRKADGMSLCCFFINASHSLSLFPSVPLCLSLCLSPSPALSPSPSLSLPLPLLVSLSLPPSFSHCVCADYVTREPVTRSLPVTESVNTSELAEMITNAVEEGGRLSLSLSL